jgi:hypothetical protein
VKRLLLVLFALLALGVVGLGGAGATYLLMTRESGPEPVRYAVVKGDTLGKIAKANGVTVEQLREWNGIQGDLIEVGQVLLIWPAEPGAVAEVAPKKKKRRKTSGGTVTATEAPSGEADLAMPAAQACLSGPSDVEGDQGVAMAQGLSDEQVRGAMSAFVGNSLRCFPPGTPSGRIHTSITVGCDGRVSAVGIEDDGGLPDAVVSCVRETLGYAPFPAHDMPDGYAFDYPLRFEAP